VAGSSSTARANRAGQTPWASFRARRLPAPLVVATAAMTVYVSRAGVQPPAPQQVLAEVSADLIGLSAWTDKSAPAGCGSD